MNGVRTRDPSRMLHQTRRPCREIRHSLGFGCTDGLRYNTSAIWQSERKIEIASINEQEHESGARERDGVA